MMQQKAVRPRRTRVLCAAGALGLAAVALGAQARPAIGHAATPIKIGLSVSLSGDYSADGLTIEQGYQLWADAVNKQGGLLGRPVQLDILSDASSPVQTTTDYQKLITIDHCDLVFGPFSTSLTKPAARVANRYGYALAEGAGGGPSVFTQGLNNVFDVSLPVANNLISFAQYIKGLPAAKRPKTAAYATEDDPFTKPQLDIARAILEKAGVRTVYNATYPAETTDYTPIAAAVIHSRAQIGLFGTLLPDIVAFMQSFKQQHYNPEALIATAGPDQGSQFTKAVGMANTEGVFVPNGWYAGVHNYGNAAMVKAYLAKYGGTADSISSDVPEAYSVGQVVQQAVTKNHSFDNAALIKTLHSGTFNSVQGTVRFDATGQNVAAQAYLFQWQKGRLIPVYPASEATAKPEFPKPQWR